MRKQIIFLLLLSIFSIKRVSAQTHGDWCEVGATTFGKLTANSANILNGVAGGFANGKAVFFLVPVSGRNWELYDVTAWAVKNGPGCGPTDFSVALMKYENGVLTKIVQGSQSINTSGEVYPLNLQQNVDLHFSSTAKLAVAIKSTCATAGTGITYGSTGTTFYTFSEPWNLGNWNASYNVGSEASFTLAGVSPDIQLTYYPRVLSGDRTTGKQLAGSGKTLAVDPSTGNRRKVTTQCYTTGDENSLIWDFDSGALRRFGP